MRVLRLSFRFYWIWKVVEAAFIGGLDGRANINNVNDRLKAATSWHSIYGVEPAMAHV